MSCNYNDINNKNGLKMSMFGLVGVIRTRRGSGLGLMGHIGTILCGRRALADWGTVRTVS